jgi:hypothetical protein
MPVAKRYRLKSIKNKLHPLKKVRTLKREKIINPYSRVKKKASPN